MDIIVHASLSSLGRVEGGPRAVVESLRAAVGDTGTLVAPTFTPRVADPCPGVSGGTDPSTLELRAGVPVFHSGLPSEMGAIPEYLRSLPDSVRSTHPQVSVSAIGPNAEFIAGGHQPLGFAVGKGSPFDRLHMLDGCVLLIGVGHNRNTYLHYAESLTPTPRLKLRRFPVEYGGERMWVEVPDVANDDTFFPVVGREFEEEHGLRPVRVGDALCRLIRIRPFVSFAVRRLTELLAPRT